MYPRNAVSPERVALGQVILIADGIVQSTGVAVTVRGQGGAEAASGGTIAFGADNTVYYTPTQAETNFTSVVFIASKASCFSASLTIVTTASATPGKVVLSGETHTSAVIPTVTTLTGHTAQTGDSFARIGATGSGLTSLATQASVDAVDNFIDTEIAAIKAKTDLIPAAPAAVGDIPTAIQNADTLLDRNMATGTDSGSPTVRTVRQALRFLRNKWSISAGTLTVTKEDDATASFTATVTTDAAAVPIIGNDPA